jgi:hypothetical protein
MYRIEGQPEPCLGIVRGDELESFRNRLIESVFGLGEYYKRAHVRKLFNQLDRWIVRRIWSHRFKRWRNSGWKQLPTAALFGE